MLAEIAKGNDPGSDRIAARNEKTVADLIDLYEEKGCRILRGKRRGQPMKPRNKAYTINALRHHVVPLIGKERVSTITIATIDDMASAITAGKTAKDEKIGPRKRIIVRGGPGVSRRVLRCLSAVFTFAIDRGIVSSNPVQKAPVDKTDNRRTRFLDLDEVRRLGRALDELEAEGVNPKAIDMVRLWALTGCRRDEIAGLKWSEIDATRACLRLADSKTGRNVRPLAAPALALLATLPRSADSNAPGGLSPWVFPSSRGDGHFQGTKRIWPKVVKRAGLTGVTPHTLRHTLGSTAVSFGETLAMTGAILGQADQRSTSIYAHVQHDPAARAADRAVGPIAAALAGKPAAKLLSTIERKAEE